MTEDMFYNEFHLVDLRVMDNRLAITEGVDRVFNLAAGMGGIGFIHLHSGGEIPSHSQNELCNTLQGILAGFSQRWNPGEAWDVCPQGRSRQAEDSSDPSPASALEKI